MNQRAALRSLRAWGQGVSLSALAVFFSLNSALAEPAQAPETSPFPLQISVTEASSLLYHANNRNSRPGNVSSEVDDHYGVWLNRLTTSGNWKQLQLEVRLDSAWFYTSRSPTDVALTLLERERAGAQATNYSPQDANYFLSKYAEAGRELSTRAVNWVYPAKYRVAYQTSDFELSVGDTYAQFGRGLVLSLRKQDELASDTTLRGLRLNLRGSLEQTRLRLTALAGSANPLRIDEASGRFLGTTRAAYHGLASVTEAGMPRAIGNDFVPNPQANFIPDMLLGTELTARRGRVALGSGVVHLSRGCIAQSPDPSVSGESERRTGRCQSLGSDPSRSAQQIVNASLNAEVSALPFEGVLYAEWAEQWRTPFAETDAPENRGHALYASLNLNPKPVLLTGEFKHYRAFFPLSASVDPSHAREFTPVQYSTPPTTESVWTDTEFEFFNSCVTGGKLRADAPLTDTVRWFGWVGRYDTWGERGSSCTPNLRSLNRVWDLAQGIEATDARRTTSLHTTLGLRLDQSATPVQTADNRETDAFYRELYLRYDLHQKLTDHLNLELSGWHRRRSQALGGPAKPWFQGTTETGLSSGNWLFALGFEYDQNPAFPATYLNGLLRYNLTSDSNLALFVGQRRGGLRCVSGVCRVFPPFEGARLDATFRF